MTIDEKMDLLISSIDSKFGIIESKIDSLENKIDTIENKIDTLENKVNTMQEDIEALKRTSYIVENDLIPKVDLLMENHTDLAKNVLIAKGIEERVNVLEFDVKLIKNILHSKTL